MASPAPGTPAAANNGSWTSFVKSISSFNGDLSSLTAPPFILSSQSLTEFSSYWATHPSILTAPVAEPDAAKRAALVLKWFLSTLKHQYASRSEQYGNEKKPLNPFLGELFLGTWTDSVGETTLVSEQVSHHPPATAYCIRNDKTGVKLEGYNAQKASFSSTIVVKQIGHALLTLPLDGGKEKETYLITLPSLHIEGLLFGAPFVELDGCSYITSSSGFTSKIKFSGKGWMSGEKNTVSAIVFPTGREDCDRDVLYSMTGSWTKELTLFEGPAKKKKVLETYCAANAASTQTELSVKSIDQQHPLESRRAWEHVAAAIAKGDMDATSAEKTKIEQAQRDRRVKEQADGATWVRRYFTAIEGVDPTLKALGAAVGIPPDGDSDKTGGLWRFDPAKAEKAAAEKLSPEDIREIEKSLLGR
ncbi:oxysterol-binding protein-related protein 9/10/11 [Geosmithia morbida]|uniref:Oxysterol-binding protein-related protein 9/10/11 n=1 Tax=Geosmithia morbida TaxID=1094350 RepID=A0A9P5D149_9HYPO|nr:oxysterol-binding protein-related protein 9/10/11 [Geosmithia morbida]KAF4122357.1 oxysterol-binding protein-related protein 9/10/11 [Geosmithia morbida]